MNNDQKIRGWVFVVGILLIVAVAAAIIVKIVYQGVQQTQHAIQPVGNLANGVGTQVAQLLHPTPTILPDPETILEDVRTLAKLETIQYSIEKIITAETGQGPFGFLFGDKLIFVAHGRVIAGVDLGKLSADQIQVEQGTLRIQLPEAEIFETVLDNQRSYIYNRDKGLFTQGDINLETAARQAAILEIEDAAAEDGILDQAQRNAEIYLGNLLIHLGFPKVDFK
jgi:hypothetical protein